jgi:Ca2+-binding EF-hand superfamily protein
MFEANICSFSNCRQSKLSQEQLAELQKSTHFDKKELQQWYKGEHRQDQELDNS